MSESKNQIVPQLVGIIVAIVVFACVLVPITSSLNDGGDGGSGEQTITNTGVGYALADRDEAEHTIVLGKDGNDKMTVTVDGEPITIRTFPESDLTSMDRFTLGISAEDNYLITAYGYGSVVGFGYGPNAEDEFGSWENGLTLTVQNGVISAGSTTHNIDLYLSSTPDYVWCTDHPKAPLDDETIYLGYWDAVFDSAYDEFTASAFIEFGNGAEVLFKGNVTDMENGLGCYTDDDYFYVSSENFTIEVSSENGYYEVTTLEADYGSSEKWLPGVIVPASFTIAGSGSGSDSGSTNGVLGTLIEVIPVFVAIALILAIVGVFYTPRNQH